MAPFTKFGRVKRNHILSQYGNNFLQAPWAGGIVLVVCVVIAMLLAKYTPVMAVVSNIISEKYSL